MMISPRDGPNGSIGGGGPSAVGTGTASNVGGMSRLAQRLCGHSTTKARPITLSIGT
jgi:hypothetical protein